MKKNFISSAMALMMLISILSFSDVKAQNKNIVTFSPLGLVNKIRFKYEHGINDIFSTGMVASYYYGAFPGGQVEPFIRYYFGEEAPEGIFLQGKLVGGSYKYIFSDVSSVNNFNFFSGGAGLSIGYQKLTGKNKNFPIEFSIGIKIVNPPVAPTNLNNTVDLLNKGLFLFTGPGSVFDGSFSLGFAF